MYNCAVQGPQAAQNVIDGLRRLDADRTVEVIVIARGGGSVEDLLPFSDEGLVRAVSACRTPVVSAIGHESDNPILDLVADNGLAPGDRLPVVCQTTGERTTNGNDGDAADDANPLLADSRLWYGARLDDGSIGYLSEIWLSPIDRGGLGLPRCP